MKKQLLYLSALLLPAVTQAKIKFTDVQPDTVLAATVTQGAVRFDIDIDGDGTTDFYVKHFNGGSFGIQAEFYTEVAGTGEVLVNATNNPLALEANEDISATQTTWVNKAGASFSSALMMGPTFGGQAERYVGVRVKNGSKWNYGWVKMSVTGGSTSMTLYEYALNETLDEAITAGQVFPTAVADVANNLPVKVYPNPMKNIATIESLVPNASFTLYDQYGRVVKSIKTANEMKIQLYREDMSAGHYYYELKQDETKIAGGRLIIVD